MTRLVLIRHGESNVTVRRVVGGLATCDGLSPRGRRQAEALAARLRTTGELAPVDAVYTSTLPRARETAELLAPALGDRIEVDAGLCELHPGEADGLTWEEAEARFGPFDLAADPYRPMSPQGESLAAFHLRVGEVVDRIVRNHAGQTVVVVCHGGVVSAALRALLDLPMLGRFFIAVDNTSLTELRRSDDVMRSAGTGPVWALVRVNDAAHLATLRA